MTTPQLVLASASPSRLRLLHDAGFDPVVIVSGVDETSYPDDDPWSLVERLAVAKATTVADRVEVPSLVVGCDSLLLFDGEAYGKPLTAEAATQRWQRMRGRYGSLITGHCVVDTGSGRQVSDVADTVVRFGSPSDAEIAAYVATREPLDVAGGFTLEGRAAAFIDGIEGEPSNVVGLSLPTLRRLLHQLDVAIIDLWHH